MKDDHLLFFANRLFYRHLVAREGLGSAGRFIPSYGMAECTPSPELKAARNAIRDLVGEFCGYIREGDPDATPAEFVRQFTIVLDRVSPLVEDTKRFYARLTEGPSMQKPIPLDMARPLDERYSRAA